MQVTYICCSPFDTLLTQLQIALIVLQYKHLQLYQEAIKVFVYSVKLKLELSILSKLVDLVHDNRVTHSTTLNTVEDSNIEGQKHSEMIESAGHRVSTWHGHHESGKHATVSGAQTKFEDGRTRKDKSFKSSPESINHTNDKGDDVSYSHVPLQPFQSSARMSGRESDMMYAEYLTSYK